MKNSTIPFLLFILGLLIIISGNFSLHIGSKVDVGIMKWPGGLILILLGIYTYIKRDKKVNIEYSKCPKCGETYFYDRLEDGICPKCKIKTIDMEKYYNNKT